MEEMIDYIVSVLTDIADRPVVIFVGPPSRTWKKDIDLLQQLMFVVGSVRPEALVVHAGRYPFDYWVEETAATAGLELYMDGPADKTVRLTGDYFRDPYLAQHASLLVAFPREDADGTEYPVESADVGVVRIAQGGGVPILVVRRSGSWALGGN